MNDIECSINAFCFLLKKSDYSLRLFLDIYGFHNLAIKN